MAGEAKGRLPSANPSCRVHRGGWSPPAHSLLSRSPNPQPPRRSRAFLTRPLPHHPGRPRPSRTKQRGDEGVRSDPQRWGAWGAEGAPCGGFHKGGPAPLWSAEPINRSFSTLAPPVPFSTPAGRWGCLPQSSESKHSQEVRPVEAIGARRFPPLPQSEPATPSPISGLPHPPPPPPPRPAPPQQDKTAGGRGGPLGPPAVGGVGGRRGPLRGIP